ncbi:MAG: hypothetical protein WB782_01645 [Thermoplasmata archaeon]
MGPERETPRAPTPKLFPSKRASRILYRTVEATDRREIPRETVRRAFAQFAKTYKPSSDDLFDYSLRTGLELAFERNVRAQIQREDEETEDIRPLWVRAEVRAHRYPDCLKDPTSEETEEKEEDLEEDDAEEEEADDLSEDDLELQRVGRQMERDGSDRKTVLKALKVSRWKADRLLGKRGHHATPASRARFAKLLREKP